MSATNRDIVVSSNLNTEYISPCSHEEADYRMLLHVSDMARNNITKIRIRTIDTDVPLIAIAHFNDIPGLEELWISYGERKLVNLYPFIK